MYSLTVKSAFDAAHFLPNHKGKCANIHGHTWQVEAVITGESLNDDGMLIDFSDVKAYIKDTLLALDHKLINDLDYFKIKAPTAENIAYYIFKHLQNNIPMMDGISVTAVTVWESLSSASTYQEG